MNTRKLSIMAILLAVNVVVSFFYIPVGVNLRIYFTFLITMMIAANYPLPMALLYAFTEDLVSFFVYPTGPFFAGYTLTAVLSMAIYWLFLHKKVDWKRVLAAKASVNILINILLGSLWSYLLYGRGYLYYLGRSLVKNLVLIPVEVLLFLFFYKLVQPLFDKYTRRIDG